jgi:hypothetical protein
LSQLSPLPIEYKLHKGFEFAGTLEFAMPNVYRMGGTPLEFGFPFVPRAILVIGFASGEQAMIAEPISIAMPKRI